MLPPVTLSGLNIGNARSGIALSKFESKDSRQGCVWEGLIDLFP